MVNRQALDLNHPAHRRLLEGAKVMQWRVWLIGTLLALGAAKPALADNRIIVRSTLAQSALQLACNPPLLPPICTVVGSLGDPLHQVFLITSPLNLTGLLNLLGNPLGIVDAELDQVLSLVGGNNILGAIPVGLLDMTAANYCGGTVWNGYATQPAADVVHVAQAQNNCTVTGVGIVADIDTGVDLNHPVLKPVLLPGYDFTRDQQDASEINDLKPADF